MPRFSTHLPILLFVALALVANCAHAKAPRSGNSAGSNSKDQSTEGLKARFESARPEDRAELATKIAQQQLRAADKLYIDGKPEQGRAAVEDVVAYSKKARDAATQAKKRLKNVEIDVRRITEKLRDIKRTVSFEDQAPVEEAIRQLEEVRTSLLQVMFAKDEKKKGSK